MKRAGHEVHLISCTDGPLLAKAAGLGATARVVAMPASMAAAGESGALKTIARALVIGPSDFAVRAAAWAHD